MIKVNKRLNLIKPYKPSERDFDEAFTKLDWNECTIQYGNELKKIVFDSLKEINFNEYPNINNVELIYKLSTYCGVEYKNIQIFNGSDSALQYIFSTFLNLDSSVLIFYPNYTQIETQINLYCDNIIYSKILDPFNNHIYNFKDIEYADVIYLSNPNNPTGFCLDSILIEELLKLYPNKLFIIDEAYYEFSSKSCVSLVQKYDNIIVTRTFSKALSLASIRLGYICANENLIGYINKIRNIKDVNSFAQKLGCIILDNYHLIQERIDLILNNRNLFQEELKKYNIKFVNSEANFVLIYLNDFNNKINELRQEKILVRDRSMFDGLENCVRITIGELDVMKKIIEIIR
jgi:histidinol-phosphate aminotransferase